MLGRQLLFVMGRDAGNEYAPTLLGSLPACINDADGVCTMVRPIPSPSIHLQLPDIWQPADVCLSRPCRSPSTTRTDRFSFRLTPALSAPPESWTLAAGDFVGCCRVWRCRGALRVRRRALLPDE